MNANLISKRGLGALALAMVALIGCSAAPAADESSANAASTKPPPPQIERASPLFFSGFENGQESARGAYGPGGNGGCVAGNCAAAGHLRRISCLYDQKRCQIDIYKKPEDVSATGTNASSCIYGAIQQLTASPGFEPGGDCSNTTAIEGMLVLQVVTQSGASCAQPDQQLEHKVNFAYRYTYRYECATHALWVTPEGDPSKPSFQGATDELCGDNGDGTSGDSTCWSSVGADPNQSK